MLTVYRFTDSERRRQSAKQVFLVDAALLVLPAEPPAGRAHRQPPDVEPALSTMAGNRQPSVLLLGSEMAARAAAAAAGGPTSNSLQHAMAASSALAGSPYYPAPGAGVQVSAPNVYP